MLRTIGAQTLSYCLMISEEVWNSLAALVASYDLHQDLRHTDILIFHELHLKC